MPFFIGHLDKAIFFNYNYLDFNGVMSGKLDFLISASENPQEIFTVKEACKFLRVGRTSFDTAVKAGQIRFKKNGPCYLFKKAWLLDWMER